MKGSNTPVPNGESLKPARTISFVEKYLQESSSKQGEVIRQVNQKATPKEVSLVEKIASGMIGSALEVTVRQPLLAVQTYSIVHKCGALEAAKKIYNLGGPLKFYDGVQGISIAYGARAVHRTGVFLMNDALKDRGVPNLAIAATATIYEVAVTGVSDTMFTLAQSQTQKGTIKSPIYLLKHQIKEHGLNKVLGAGFAGSFLRNTFFNVGYLMPGNVWPEYRQENPITTGLGSGFLGVLISHPFEVLRARQVAHPSQTFGEHISDGFRKGVLKEFSRGLGARLASAGLGSAISYTVYAKLTNSNASSSSRSM